MLSSSTSASILRKQKLINSHKDSYIKSDAFLLSLNTHNTSVQFSLFNLLKTKLDIKAEMEEVN